MIESAGGMIPFICHVFSNFMVFLIFYSFAINKKFCTKFAIKRCIFIFF